MEEEIQKDEAKILPGLGDYGRAVELSGEQLKKAKDIMKKEAFNLLLSNRIAYNRTILDARHPRFAKI